MQDGSFYWLRSQFKIWAPANVDNLLSYHFLHQVLKTDWFSHIDIDTNADSNVSWIPFIIQFILPAGQLREGEVRNMK